MEEYVAVPKELVSRNKFISISDDILFVDGIAFLLTVAIKIRFVTVEHTPVRTDKSLVTQRRTSRLPRQHVNYNV